MLPHEKLEVYRKALDFMGYAKGLLGQDCR
jgi:hypothetical protein